ncbi:MAG: tetratricopeptide repeat protein [Thermoanaerobaculia bacterium]
MTSESESPSADTYEAAFDRAVLAVRREVRSSRVLSADAALRLARGFLSGRAAMAIREASVPLVDALIGVAAELAGEDAERALEASKLAVSVSQRLKRNDCLTGSARLRALNSLILRARDAADYVLGQKAADEASVVLRDFACPPDDEIDCLLAIACFYYETGAFEEVLFFSEDALHLGVELDDHNRMSRSLRLIACACSAKGNYRESIDTLWKALDLTRDARARWVCCQNLALDYCALGHYRAARGMLDEAAASSFPGATTQDELRLLWARARIDAEAGVLSDVVSCLETVAEGFLQLGHPKTFAESAVEIACIFARQGRWKDAVRLAEHCAEWFSSLGLPQEAAAAKAIASGTRGRATVERALIDFAQSIREKAGRPCPPPSI